MKHEASHWGLSFTPDLKPARLGVDSLMDLAMPLFHRMEHGIAAAIKAEGNKETQRHLGHYEAFG